MEIILTHEQADFDALAAMLATHLLCIQAKPVLPNKINRNLRKFINLYGFELPFIEIRDLLPQSIKTITLVDTQSLVTLKGINKNTKIHVIDHHQEKPDLPLEWTKTIEKLGATTTILVDLLREQNVQLSMIQATMLLLGIYEDTGSLSYASTTVKDVKAAAYLLEKGANLRIAADFLNPPLSDAQRKLADLLLENCKTINVQDKTILISSADGQSMHEEISSVAHKIRDLLDPDALFLFVRTSEGIRLIARSTSDDINVGKIANTFGGGGHERASAALIQLDTSGSISETQQMVLAIDKLVSELHTEIRPSLTVNKIMSKKPHLISTDTSLPEVETLMQRYGYEGYPVVKEGKVVGLLTRRAVDRAHSHRLSITAGSLMEAGNYTLTPEQSVEQVQNLMATTGWGQIPVIDPSTEKIIGIVTRTDVLKTLTKRDKPRSKQSGYASLIEKALTPALLSLLKNIISAANQEHLPLYIVGGFVRDLILGTPSKDFDIVVEGDALQLGQSLVRTFGGRIVSHRRFGTAKWQIKDIRKSLMEEFKCPVQNYMELPEALDLISARVEFYDHPTALPTVERSSIKQDLHRRDFTINTLALRLDGSHFGELHDFWGGMNDLKKKEVKVLHSLSFVDDPTRMLRAVRFEQRFGFQIEERTLQLIAEARPMLKQVSGDRIRHEFDLIFNESNPCMMIDRLNSLNLLSAIHPDLKWNSSWSPKIHSVLHDEIPSDWSLPKNIGSVPIRTALAYLSWLLLLDRSSAIAVGERLHFSNGLLHAVNLITSLWEKKAELLAMPASIFSENLRRAPVFGIFCIYHLSSEPEMQKKILRFITEWQFVEPYTNGKILAEMGVPPGPKYAMIINELRNARIDGKIATLEQENDYLERLLQNNY